ncbi:cation:proton antiporter domain-containing protein [Geodermatophilus marinus]|uniref:cation:proton antiporter domain-containing protein n=1 Tax=Geodermatophilus sp. LHW52908 TaxID=2303986 RepID=UPI000E3EA06E|nr:cation:proton antiporter [Geodermatophilus sp. LHW52908]RFU22021.1 sodium:proton antiporter [Geodermatophilus sp. LHW52908]
MDDAVVAVVAAAVFAWGVLSARLERADLTAPIVFLGLGALLAAAGVADGATDPGVLRSLAEVTLVWVLFSDAARVRPQDLREDSGRYLRLLLVGLPLTVGAGWATAAWILPGVDVWLALLVAAALAPTDAALGLPVVSDPAVPARVRRMITVESGLNDGIATPVVMFALAGAASAEGLAGAPGLPEALLELAVGAATGAGLGAAGGALLRQARRHGWAEEGFAGIAVLALALAAYAGALVVDGNGFVAAFCGGLAFGATAGRRGPAELEFTEQASGLVSLLVWLVFGAVAVPVVVDAASPAAVVYALASLTVLRLVPVALALLGSGLDRATVLFVGWFGPRGLASVVFALIALEELGAGAEAATVVIALTVVLSVLAHGATAGPLAARYGARPHPAPAEGRPGRGAADLPLRGLHPRSSSRPVTRSEGGRVPGPPSSWGRRARRGGGGR